MVKNVEDLNIGDLVYFQKSDSDPMGMISALEENRDDIVRKVITNRNASEQQDRTTRRNVRSICKIWSEDDTNIQAALSQVANFLKDLKVDIVVNEDDDKIPKLAAFFVTGVAASLIVQFYIVQVEGLEFYQALVNIQNEMFDATEDLSYLKKETCDDYHDATEDTNEDEDDGAVDSLSNYLLNFKL